MKIVHQPTPRHRLPPEPAPASVSFADMIASPLAEGGRVEDLGRAAGFSTLGMFGRFGAVAAPASNGELAPAVARPPAHPAVTPASFDGATEAPAPHAAIREKLDRSARASGDAAARLPARVVNAATDALPPEPCAAGEAGGEAVEPMVAEADGPVSTDARARPDKGPGGPAVRFVAATDTSGTVVVAAPQLSDEDAQRFRSRADALLREHGLALDRLTINGEDRPAVDPLGRGSQWR